MSRSAGGDLPNGRRAPPPTSVSEVGKVPNNWTVKRLKFLGNVRSGVAKGKELGDKDTVTLPYLRVANVQDGYVDLQDVSELEVTASEATRYLLRKNDVLMNEGGDNDKLGRGAVWQGQIDPCIHQNHVFAVRLANPELAEWVSRFTSTDAARTYFFLHSKQSTNLASISQSNVRELPVPMPPDGERIAIVQFLDEQTARIDDLIAEKERLLALLAEQRLSIAERVIADAPSGLRAKLGFHADLLPGYAFPSDEFSRDPENIPLLRGVNLAPANIRWDDVVYWPRNFDVSLERFRLQAGDVVFGMDRPWVSAGARVAMVDGSSSGSLLLQRVCRLRGGTKLSQRFIFYALSSDEFRQSIEVELTGVSVPHISPEQILRFKVPVLSLAEQHSRCEAADKDIDRINELEVQTSEMLGALREYRASLISAAVTGQLDISTFASA